MSELTLAHRSFRRRLNLELGGKAVEDYEGSFGVVRNRPILEMRYQSRTLIRTDGDGSLSIGQEVYRDSPRLRHGFFSGVRELRSDTSSIRIANTSKGFALGHSQQFEAIVNFRPHVLSTNTTRRYGLIPSLSASLVLMDDEGWTELSVGLLCYVWISEYERMLPT